MTQGLGDDDATRREAAHTMVGMAKVGTMLAQVVEDALRPALKNGRISACTHIHTLRSTRRTSEGRPVPQDGSRDKQILICPMHPRGGATGYTLMCEEDVVHHYRTEHHGEFDKAACFVCEAPILDPLMGELRDDFTPVFAEVVLYEALPIQYFVPGDPRGSDAYVGDLATLPVAYLCPRHADAADLPIRMGWPMGKPSKEIPPPPPPVPF